MSIWDDLIRYFGQLAFLGLICSAVFWGIASGSLAINAKSKNPLIHLVLGAMLHFIWFIVVGILAIITISRSKKTADTPTSNVVATPSDGFADW